MIVADGPETGCFVRVNRAFCRMTGYGEDALRRLTIQDITPAEDLEIELPQLERLIRGEIDTYTMEKRIIRADGEPLWVLLQVMRFPRLVEGHPCALGQMTDITALKDVLQSREAVVDSALDAIITADAGGTILEFNPAAERTFGYTAEEAIGRSLDIVVPPRIRPRVQRVLSGQADERLGSRVELEAMHADGFEFPVELTVTRTLDDPPIFTGFVRDLRGEVEAKQALEESEARYRRIIETTSEGVWTLDADDRTTFINAVGAEMLGYTVDEMIGKTPEELMDDEGRELHRAAMDRTRQGSAVNYTGKLLHRDGHVVWTSVAASPLVDDDGAYMGTLAMMTDITDQLAAEEARKEMEAELNQARRLETVGRLAGGVAHDFNNLLSVIGGYAELAQTSLDDPEEAGEALGEVRRATDRAAALTRQLLAFGRRDVQRAEVVDLRELVAGVPELLGPAIGEGVDLEVDVPDEPMLVRADVHQLEQVLLNLALNARDAMPSGGRLRITVQDSHAKNRHYRALTVADTGSGMSDEVVDHAFDPFFTTKPPGSGSGLGLALVYASVTQAGGSVGIESEPGRGTTIIVRLPAVEGEEGRSERREPAEPARATGETVLVVDDEERLRRLTRRILEGHGYRVLDAPSAEDALALVRGLPDPLDLVITDQAMPGMSGAELVEALAVDERRPRVIVMSGSVERSLVESEALAGTARVLQKPVSADELLRAADEALSGPLPR